MHIRRLPVLCEKGKGRAIQNTNGKIAAVSSFVLRGIYNFQMKTKGTKKMAKSNTTLIKLVAVMALNWSMQRPSSPGT